MRLYIRSILRPSAYTPSSRTSARPDPGSRRQYRRAQIISAPEQIRIKILLERPVIHDGNRPKRRIPFPDAIHCETCSEKPAQITAAAGLPGAATTLAAKLQRIQQRATGVGIDLNE